MRSHFQKDKHGLICYCVAKHSDENFLDRRGNLIEGKTWYIYKSERFLAERWGWSRKKVACYLSQLTQDNMIEMVKKKSQ